MWKKVGAVSYGLATVRPELEPHLLLTVKLDPDDHLNWKTLDRLRKGLQDGLNHKGIPFLLGTDYGDPGLHLHAVILKAVGTDPVIPELVVHLTEKASRRAGIDPPQVHFRVIEEDDGGVVPYVVGKKEMSKFWAIPSELSGKRLVFLSRNLFPGWTLKDLERAFVNQWKSGRGEDRNNDDLLRRSYAKLAHFVRLRGNPLRLALIEQGVGS